MKSLHNSCPFIYVTSSVTKNDEIKTKIIFHFEFSNLYLVNCICTWILCKKKTNQQAKHILLVCCAR